MYTLMSQKTFTRFFLSRKRFTHFVRNFFGALKVAIRKVQTFWASGEGEGGGGGGGGGKRRNSCIVISILKHLVTT